MPISDLDELVSAVASIVKEAGQVTNAIQADQGKGPPSEDFATYKIIPIKAIGHPRKERTDTAAEEDGPTVDWNDYAEQTITQLHCMLSVNFIGKSAATKVKNMPNAMYRLPVYELLHSNDITWAGTSEIRDLTAINGAKIQPRYQIDVHIVVETQITDTVLKANAFSYELQDESGNILSEGEG